MSYDTKYQTEYTGGYRKLRRAWAIDFLGAKCAQCGTIENLEFDHIDRSTKIGNISSMLTVSKDKFLTELLKCQLLCKSCHIKKSSDEQKPDHGTFGMYQRHKCRCEECSSFYNAYQREYKSRAN